MIPGTRTTIKAALESPEATEASVTYMVVMMRSFLLRLLGARNLVDVQIAAGAALQDLDEWAGNGQYEEINPEADLN